MVGDITIESIENDRVVVSFNMRGVVRINENGTINLLSEEHSWIDEISFGEEYELVSQTMSSGKFWSIVFNAI